MWPNEANRGLECYRTQTFEDKKKTKNEKSEQLHFSTIHMENNLLSSQILF